MLIVSHHVSHWESQFLGVACSFRIVEIIFIFTAPFLGEVFSPCPSGQTSGENMHDLDSLQDLFIIVIFQCFLETML